MVSRKEYKGRVNESLKMIEKVHQQNDDDEVYDDETNQFYGADFSFQSTFYISKLYDVAQ